jgi:hypothetical protein
VDSILKMVRVFTKFGQLKTKATTPTGSYAPLDASYIVTSLEVGLPNDRRLQVDGDLTLTDGGPGNDITIGSVTKYANILMLGGM